MTTNCSKSTAMLHEPTGILSVNIVIFLALGSVLVVITIISNGLFMLTLIKKVALHTPSNMLLGTLCFSDSLVGFVVQPLYLAHYAIIEANHTINSDVIYAMYRSLYFFGGLSFTNAVLISMDRYVAICFPYKYHTWATCRSHITLGASWFFAWAVMTFFEYYIGNAIMVTTLRILYFSTGMIIVLYTYFNIYRVVRTKKNVVVGIIGLGHQQCAEMQLKRREKHKTYTIALIIVTFFACYLPWLLLYLIGSFSRNFCWFTEVVMIAEMWISFPVLLNSFLNPVIYYVRSTEIRHAVFRVLSFKRIGVR